MLKKEDLEKEVEQLKEQLNVRLSRIQMLKQNLTDLTNETIAINGAIEQTNKLLALYEDEKENKGGK